MQEDYPIPATGTVPYQYLEVPANFKEDRWITGWEIRPGDRKAVHHIIVQMRPGPEQLAAIQQQMRAAQAAAAAAAPGAPPTPRPLPVFSFNPPPNLPDGQSGGRPLPPDQRPAPTPNDRPRPPGTGAPLGGYVPGSGVAYFPEGTALRLPAGYSLVFQMHYTPYGKATTDRTKIGLTFAQEPPKTILNVAAMLNGGLHIPAGAANHEVDAEMTINRDVILYSFVPHTHVRGTGWYYEATYPDGRKEVLLSVPKYRLQLAARVRVQRAAEDSGRHQDRREGVVQQLAVEQVESGSDQGRDVGRSDMGRDDVHEHHLQHRHGAGADAARSTVVPA